MNSGAGRGGRRTGLPGVEGTFCRARDAVPLCSRPRPLSALPSRRETLAPSSESQEAKTACGAFSSAIFVDVMDARKKPSLIVSVGPPHPPHRGKQFKGFLSGSVPESSLCIRGNFTSVATFSWWKDYSRLPAPGSPSL